MVDGQPATDPVFAAAVEDADEDDLVRAVYGELRMMARHFLRGERDQQTLQTTALVHEAYLKLVGSKNVSKRGRAYFFGAAAQAMRQVLVDAARKRHRQKRGAGERPATLDDMQAGDGSQSEQVLWVNDALDRFASSYPRHAKVVECRFFGGLSLEETAQVVETSVRTVKRDWAFAQAWLYREWSE